MEEIELGTLIFYFDKETEISYINCFNKDGWTGFVQVDNSVRELLKQA